MSNMPTKPTIKTTKAMAGASPAKSTKASASTAKATAKPAAKSTKLTTKTNVKEAAKPAPKSVVKVTPKPTVRKKAVSATEDLFKHATLAAAAPKVHIAITTEEIATRAYFIAERRQLMGWPGDSKTDWIEAETQLLAESKKKKA
jgi:hypothetical protein